MTLARTLALLLSATASLIPLPAQGAGGGKVVEGEVIDEQGRPLEGVCVRVGSRALTVDEVMRAPSLKTDADGRFALNRAEHEGVFLYVAARGRVAWCSPITTQMVEGMIVNPFGVDGPQEISRVLVSLEKGWTAVGRVRDAKGQPVVGVSVRFTDLLDEGMFGLNGRTNLRGMAKSDETGIFRLPGLPRVGARVRVTCPGYAGVTVAPVAMGTPLDLELRKLTPIRGTLRDDLGRPIAGRVRVEHFEDMGEWVRVGADGVFELQRLAHGNVRIGADTPDGRTGFAFENVRGDGRVDVSLDAPAAPGPRIELVDAAGQPVPIHKARFAWSDPEVPSAFFDQLDPFDLTADAGGEWHLPQPIDGMATGYLRVSSQGLATKIVAVMLDMDEEVFRVQTGNAGRVEGRVRVRGEEGAVAGASVWVIARDGQRDVIEQSSAPADAVTTGPDGSFVIEGLAPGRYLVISERAGVIGRPRPVRVREGEAASTVLSVPKFRKLEGTVKGIRDSRLRVLIDRAPHPDLLTGVISFSGMSMVTARPGIRPGPDGRIHHTTAEFGKLGTSFMLPGARVGPARISPIFEFFNVADETFAVDGSAVKPGRIHGRIRVTSSRLPMERLVVLAQPVAQEWLVFDLGIDLSGFRAVPATNGTFDLPLFAGEYRLLVVDMVTGLVFAREKAFPLMVGEERQFDLEVEAGEVEVKLLGNGTSIESVIGIQCSKIEEREDDTVGLGFAMMHDQWPGHLAPRNPGVRTLRLPVPPGTLKVRAVTRSGQVLPMPVALVAGQQEELTSSEIDVDADERVTVELRPGG